MRLLRRQPWFIIGLVVIFLSLFPGSASAGGILNLNPEHGTCKDRILFEGLAFPPRSEVALSIRQVEPFSDQSIQFATITISPEGAIVVIIPVEQMITQCATASPPAAGTSYVISVTPSGKNPQGLVYAQATFTLDGASMPGLPNTGGGHGGSPASPTLTLDPASGSCTTKVTAHGSGFTPGVTIHFLLVRDRDGAVTVGNSTGGGEPAQSDGTYAFTISLSGCGPDEPSGSTFTISMFEYRPNSTPTRGAEASAKFTVTASATTPGLPNTGGGWAASQVTSPVGTTLAFGLIILGVALRYRRIVQVRR